MIAQPIHELNIDFLGRQSGINQKKSTGKVITFIKIAPNHPFKLLFLCLRKLGEAEAGKIDEAPPPSPLPQVGGGARNFKKVDQPRFSWGSGDFGQTFLAGKHIDKGGFPHIRPPDECELRDIPFRTGFQVGGRTDKRNIFDFHYLCIFFKDMQIILKPTSLEQLWKDRSIDFEEIMKIVVDVNKNILAVDAEMHADLEKILLESGSAQNDLWGANVYPMNKADENLEYTSFINIRPSMGNRSMEVKDEIIRRKIQHIVHSLLT
jgi:hypothetical protein